MPATYSPQDVAVTLGGYLIDGFAPDDIVSVEAGGDTVKHVRGATGHVARVIDRAPQLIKCTLSLMQTSAANTTLGLLHDAQRVPGSKPLPFVLKNLNGGEGVTIPAASVLRKPGPDFGNDSKVRQWIIEGQGEITSAGAP